MNESFGPIPPEDEALPVAKILLAAATALVIFMIGIAVAWWMSLAGTMGTVPKPHAEVGRVHQRPFALEKTAQQLKHEQLQKLAGYGWVDRERQLIHIPIDRAIDQLVAGQQKEAAR